MSYHSNYHPPTANDPALDLTEAQPSHTSSSRQADRVAETPIIPLPLQDPEWTSNLGLHFRSEQPLTPGDPSTGSAQPLSVNDGLSAPFPENGQPVCPDPLITEPIPQELLTFESGPFEAIVDEMMGQQVSMEMK